MRWNGNGWRQIASASPGSQRSQLFGVGALTSTEALAAGISGNAGGSRTLTLHWDGSSWVQT